MTCSHRDLRSHIKKIKDAINSGSEYGLRVVLEKDMKALIEKIRKHKKDEDEVLYTIAKDEFTSSEWEEISRVLKI